LQTAITSDSIKQPRKRAKSSERMLDYSRSPSATYAEMLSNTLLFAPLRTNTQDWGVRRLFSGCAISARLYNRDDRSLFD
jgi:hypothetical protein